jgi:hypothetical protein
MLWNQVYIAVLLLKPKVAVALKARFPSNQRNAGGHRPPLQLRNPKIGIFVQSPVNSVFAALVYGHMIVEESDHAERPCAPNACTCTA